MERVSLEDYVCRRIEEELTSWLNTLSIYDRPDIEKAVSRFALISKLIADEINTHPYYQNLSKEDITSAFLSAQKKVDEILTNYGLKN